MNDDSCIIIDYKKYKEWVFPFGGEIGIKFHEEGYSTLAGITLGNDYVYFADRVYGRVNKLNYKSGEIIFGRKDAVNELIMDLIYFNNFIYVITLNSGIYIFNEDLDLFNKYKYSLFATAGFYFERTKDTLKINVTYSPGLHIFKLKDGSLISKEVKFVTNEADLFNLRRNTYSTVQGKYFEKIESNGNNYLKTDDGCYLLKNKIEEYEMPNLDFTDSTIVYFEVNERELTFHFLEY